MELNFKTYLEGVLDYDTTALSRAIIQALKKHEASILNLPEGANFQLTYAVDRNGSWALERTSKGIGLYVYDWSKLELPEGMKAPNLLVYASVGEPKHNGSFDRTNNILMIRIGIPLVREGRLDYNATLPLVKAVLRHELEHSTQRNEAPYTRATDYEWPTVDGKAPSGMSLSDPKSVLAYLTHPSEIEAWVAGIYKYAKTAKVSFTQAMQLQLDRFRANMARDNVEPAVIDSVIDTVRNAWLSYQKHRFPAARI
jgi:hypothetical protein